MYQPLEQFIIHYIGFIKGSEFLMNKLFLLFVFAFIFVATYSYYFNSFFGLVVRFLGEFFNIVNSTFSWLVLLFLSVFIFILLLNFFGLLPYVSCWTAQLFANLLLSFSLIFGLTLMNIDKNGMKFFNLFIPTGVPEAIKIPLFILELFSYFIRILSLSIRLFSNMVAGHTLLHILFEMSNNLHVVFEQVLDILLFVSLLSLMIILIVFAFELIVAFLQAYVFSVMFIIYSNDLQLEH